MECLIKLSSRLFPSEPSLGQIGSIELNIWLAQISGLPLVGLKKESKSLRAALIFYGLIFTTLITFFYTAFEIYDLILCWPDLDTLTQNACLSLTHLSGLTKTINTFYRYEDVRRVIEDIKWATKKYVVSKNQRKTFLRGEFENKIPLLIYILLVGFTGFLAFGMLLYNPQDIAGKTFPYRVILPFWLPYSLQLIYMGAGVFIFAMQIVSIDYLNMNLINQIRFQLKILNITFDDLIIDAGEKSLKVRKYMEIANKRVSPSERLEAIIEHHCFLRRLRADVESIFQFPILVQFFTSLIIFAMTGFQATVRADGSSRAILIYFYCGCIFCELFMYCWFGNDVFEQSKTLSVSGYNSSWYQFDKNFKTSLLIFLGNAQRPFLFTAGGFISLSLPSFTSILSKAYTYIAVLKQLYSGR